MTGEPKVLVNRTSKPLTIQKSGVQIILKPGPNHVTADWIRFAKQQHPRMGSFDASGMEGDYLVGVEGTTDDCSPIPEGEEHTAIERFDRAKMDGDASEAVGIETGVRPPVRRVPSDAMGVGPDALFTADTARG
jgi:hypothetical protein